MRVSLQNFKSVEGEERGGRTTHHHEVAVHVPELSELINAKDAGEGCAAGVAKRKILEAMIGFCREVQSVVPM